MAEKRPKQPTDEATKGEGGAPVEDRTEIAKKAAQTRWRRPQEKSDA